MELFTTGINYYREHIKPTARIHYQIEKAGDVVNVVPDKAQIWVRVRENDRERLNVVYERVKKLALHFKEQLRILKEKEAEEQKKKGLIPPEGKELDPFKRVPDNRPRLPRNPLVPPRR